MHRILALVAALAALVPVPSVALPGGVVTTHFYYFVPGDARLNAGPVLLAEGTDLQYANLDQAAHSVTSVARDDAGLPLFDSGVLAMGETGVVSGAAALAPGDHPFLCARHPALMRGVLRVT